MSTVVQGLKRIVLPIGALLAVMIGLGLLVTEVLADTWPFTVEDSVNRGLEAERSGQLNGLSLIFSTLASTYAIIVVTVLAVLFLRWVLGRWREGIFLGAAVTAQAIVFYLTTLVIDRSRPAVDHMDTSPPTSSFPSGHTSASVALYLGIGLLLALHARNTTTKSIWWAVLVMVPIGVALTRMYRGMHHPSDVVASFLNGGVCVAVMARAFLDESVTWVRSRTRGAMAKQRSGPDRARRAVS